MSDELTRDPRDPATDQPAEAEHAVDPRTTRGPTDAGSGAEPEPWLEEGAGAPDAADIEDPDEQL